MNPIRVSVAAGTAAAVLWMGGMATATGLAQPEEVRQKDQWTMTHLLEPQAKTPFSFVYGDQPSEKLLADWPRKHEIKKLDPARTEHSLTWTDPKTALEVRCVAVEYSDFPAVEWTVYFKNTGNRNTPILEVVEGLDVRFQRADAGEFVLHGIQGDWCTRDSFEPYQITLGAGVVKNRSPAASGKSCDGPDGWPYYNLQMPGGGIILAIGWPGHWRSLFERDAGNNLRIRAGQELTHLVLKPGEGIRTPLVAMLFWRGTDAMPAQNLWRRWYVAHNMPRVKGRTQQLIGDYYPLTQYSLQPDQDSFTSRTRRRGSKSDSRTTAARSASPPTRPRPARVLGRGRWSSVAT